jgi:short-subunit dehydrogenase
MKITGQHVLITGASRGLGRLMAIRFASLGAKVTIAARQKEALDTVAEEMRAVGSGPVVSIPTDVSCPLQLERLVGEAETQIGPIDILVNNAALERIEFFWEADYDAIDQDLKVNVRAPMYLSQLCVMGMLKRNMGHIVNIGSLAGLGGYTHGESYVASKHAIVGFTRALRASLKSLNGNVSASCICPGFVSDVGMFARKQASNGAIAPRILGSTDPERVVAATIKAIQRDLPEVIVNSSPIRPFLAIFALFPRFGEWLAQKTGVHAVAKQVITHESRDQ